jgi:hypothetical protein
MVAGSTIRYYGNPKLRNFRAFTHRVRVYKKFILTVLLDVYDEIQIGA